MVEAVWSRAQSTTLLKVSQYGSSIRFSARGSVPVTISPSSGASHSSEMSRYFSVSSRRRLSARGTSGIMNNFRSTTELGVAARIRSVNWRSVASTAASGMLLTRPTVMQFEALSSTADADRPESKNSGIGLVLRKRLLGRDQRRAAGLRRGQRLIEIGDDVVDVLDPDAEPDHFRPDAGFFLLLGRHLPVRRRGRVAGERFGVPHIDQPLEQTERVVKILARRKAAGDAEGQQRTGAAAEIFVGQNMILIVSKTGIIDPVDARVVAQKFGDPP